MNIQKREVAMTLLRPLYQKFSELSDESFKAWGMTDEQIQRRMDQLETELELRRAKTPDWRRQLRHLYEVRPRKDRRGVDLISDALPFGRLW
jgi:hypothetical protein